MRLLRPLAALLAGIGFAAQAADAVTDAMTTAYAPYRAALFRTNAHAPAEAAQAMAQARERWTRLVAPFAAHPPAPYDRDGRFAESIRQVDAIYDKADAQIRSGQLAEAHETLEAARDVMAELRRRNGVVTYSDHMNAFHAEMERVLGEGPKLLDAPNGALALMARAGTLEYLAQRLRSEAPAALSADAEFGPGIQALEQSVATLKSALLAQDTAKARDALSRLKKPYSQLFVKFG